MVGVQSHKRGHFLEVCLWSNQDECKGGCNYKGEHAEVMWPSVKLLWPHVNRNVITTQFCYCYAAVHWATRRASSPHNGTAYPKGSGFCSGTGGGSEPAVNSALPDKCNSKLPSASSLSLLCWSSKLMLDVGPTCCDFSVPASTSLPEPSSWKLSRESLIASPLLVASFCTRLSFACSCRHKKSTN